MGDEYIKRGDVLIKLEIAYDMARLDQKLPISNLQHEVNLIKAADVQFIKHGRWIGVDYDTFFECSECKHMTDWQNYKYCPYCGARMDGGAENE